MQSFFLHLLIISVSFFFLSLVPLLAFVQFGFLIFFLPPRFLIFFSHLLFPYFPRSVPMYWELQLLLLQLRHNLSGYLGFNKMNPNFIAIQYQEVS